MAKVKLVKEAMLSSEYEQSHYNICIILKKIKIMETKCNKICIHNLRLFSNVIIL